MAKGKKTPRLTEAKRIRLDQFIDLYRGGPDELRNSAIDCYRYVYPRCKSDKAAKRGAYETLNHPYVQEKLKAKTDEVSEKADVTQERVLKEVASIALFDPRKLFKDDGSPVPLSELDDATAAAISGIKKIKIGDDWDVLEYKISCKNQALEKLMRHLGLYQQDNEQKTSSLADALKAGIERVRGLSE